MSSYQRNPANPFPNYPNMGQKKSRRWLTISIVVVFITVVLHKLTGTLSVNFFHTVEHILHLHDKLSPVLMWGVLGILIGPIAGSFVLRKKYRLELKWNLIPIGLFIVVIGILSLTSGPMSIASGTVFLEKNPANAVVDVHASTAIEPYKQFNYGASNLLDVDNNTAWMFVNEGEAASVSFIFSRAKKADIGNIKVIGLRFKNGFSKSHNKWSEFNRMKDFTVYHNGKTIYSGVAGNKYDFFEDIDVSPVEISSGDTIKVAVNSVYRGNNRKANITAITEMTPLITYRKY